MERECDFRKRFTDHLISIGYPKESIAIEYFERGFHIDVAIIDPKTSILLQIFELKATDYSEKRFKNAQGQLKAFLSRLEVTVPAYTVFDDKENKSFKIIDCHSEERANPFDYSSFLNTGIAANKILEKQKQKQKIDQFKLICWIEVFMLIGIMACQKTGIFSFEISWIDLSIMGGAIILSLLPYLDMVSINGSGFRRRKTIESEMETVKNPELIEK